MGHYAQVTDVERYNPARAPFGPNTKPSASSVDGLILDAESEANAILQRAGFGVPVGTDTPVAYRRIQTAVAQMTAAMVENVAPTSGPDSRRSHYERMADAARRMLGNGEFSDLDRASTSRARYPVASAWFTRDMEL